MTDFFTAVSNFGFPIVVAGYLLFRFENKIENFGKRIQGFSDIIEGVPSEGKKGLIGTMEKNTDATNDLINKMQKLTKKIK